MALPTGYYTVAAVRVGNDLIASQYAVGDSMWVGAVSILCSVSVPAYACIGTPIAPLFAIDATRSGGIDSSNYLPPREVRPGQPFSVIWPNVAGGATASMVVQVVPNPGRQ